MHNKRLLTSSSIVLLFAALSAGAANYNWNGTTSTDWFTTANWSKGAGTSPWPGNGDTPRMGIVANVYPPTWPHYNGINTNSGVGPTTGAFLMAGVTNAWFFMEGGYYLHNSWVNIGNVWPYTGHWIQTGGVFDTYTYQRQFTVAAAGNGDLQISAGTIQADSWVIIRNNPGANPAPTNAWALLTGTARVTCTSSSIGIYGTAATLTNRDSAEFYSTNSLGIGGSGGGIGHFYQEGGLVTVKGSVDNGLDLYTNGSQYVLSGGSLSTSFVGSTYTNSGGALVFDGGTLKANGASQRLIRPVGSVTINAGKTALIDTAGFYERVQSGITGDGGLMKLGGGVLEFDGTNTYTGSTLVSTGTVVFAANQFLNNVTVNAGAGIGTSMDSADNHAQLARLTLQSGSALNFTLDPSEADPMPARIVLTNGLVLNGPVTVNPTLSAVPPEYTIFYLLDYGSSGISGSGGLSLGALPCGMVANLFTNGTRIGLFVTRGADKPSIGTPPASQTVQQNHPFSLSVTLAECADFAGYQWVLNGTNILAGETNATFLRQFAQSSDAGSYTVIVTNPVGSVTSSPPAVLAVIPDNVPPSPVSAMRPNTPQTRVVVVFDELLDQASAQTASNYDLTNNQAMVDVGPPTAATLGGDGKTVVLDFSAPLADTTRYAVIVAGVKDLALNAQTGAAVPVSLMGGLKPTGPNHLVVIEAEDADVITAASWEGTLRTWEIVSARPGYSGWAALQCLTNAGQTANPVSTGPVASYIINFPETDTYPITYYLWVRGAGTNSADDSCHATLDWQDFTSTILRQNIAQNMYQPNASGWGWTGRDEDHGLPRLSFVISNSGPHTVDILMREDGFFCDKLVLTTDSTYDPSMLNGGLGPMALTRAVFPPIVAFIPGTAVYSGSAFTVQLQTAAGYPNIVEYSDKLVPSSWTQLTNFAGDGSVVQIQDSSPATKGRYYRAMAVVP
jgi:autotransporter-associated beta strand protein